MKYTIYKDGSVKIKMTAAETPFMCWVLDEGLAGGSFEDDEEARSNLAPHIFKSWKHMGRPTWMGGIARFTVEEK